MTTLTEFLLARIAERESLARDMQHQASAGRPFIDPATIAGGTLIRELIDPDRLRVECETKRQIIKGEQRYRAKQDAPEHGRGWDGFEEFISLPNGAEIRGDALDAFITAWYEPSPPSRVLRLLAMPYADHEDFQEEWRV